MRSKTYFGEYTLRHWLTLMMKRNIILPDYQRSFVWSQKDIERLVQSFKAGQFIQPVTIARMHSVGGGINIVLDGQQRLTSILLLAIGYYPKKDRFKEAVMVASDDDAASSDSDTLLTNNIIEWTFERLLSSDISQNTLDLIRHRVSANEDYEALLFKNADYLMTGHELDGFLDNTFLGFSYVVPDRATSDSASEQDFFSTLFRNMNYLGKKLSPLESRKSLYYLNEDYRNYFEGRLSDGSNALAGLKILENIVPRSIDFVRYLSILSQYHGFDSKANKIMVGYSSYSSRESFYVDYVSYILGQEQEDRAGKFGNFDFSATFPDPGWEPRFERLKQTLVALKDKMDLDSKYPDTFKSWIDADYWLFGLIYWIVFKDKEISLDPDWTPNLKRDIKRKKKNPNDSYVKSPNMLGHLRDRVEKSVVFFKKHLLA